MILIAPDKYKGTLTAREAARIMSKGFSKCGDTILAPMADGGEGTAEILCSGSNWERRDSYYVDRQTRTAVIDSSAIIGLATVNPHTHNILKATSAPLGLKVREIVKGGCDTVIIGIGGTATCDGGEGFLMGLDKYATYRDKIIGLSDVSVPLVAPGDEPSALMFAPQKGATAADIEILRRRLERIYRDNPARRSRFDGAGGGLGFAIASMIGARCYSGAEYVLGNYGIDWNRVSMIVTGEGCIDRQSSEGKVVGTLAKMARLHNIPIVAFGGTVADGMEADTVISTATYHPALPLCRETAALRLKTAVEAYVAALG